MWAQVLLYGWAAEGALRALATGEPSGWGLTYVLGLCLFRGMAGYLIANESAWGFRLAVVVCPLSLWPLFDEFARSPSVLVRPDFLLLAALPFIVFGLLLSPAGRDYQRMWFG